MKLKGAWGALKDKSAKLTTSLSNSVKDSVVSKLKSAWKSLGNKTAKLKAGLTGVAVSTVEKLKKAWGAIKDKTAKLKLAFVDKLKAGYNTIANKIQVVRKKFPATKIILPDIHPLAQGGWIQKNTPQLAIVGDNRHEGEIVAPESKLMAMARQIAKESNGGGADAQVVALLTQLLVAVKNVNTDVYLDGNKIADNTVKKINQQTRTTGVSPLLV